MRVQANEIYHLHNTGNNGQLIFRHRNDYHLFLCMFKKYVGQFCEVVCWGLISKEFNFMVKVKEEGAEIIQVGNIKMSRFADGIRKLQSQFARIMNRKLGRSGAYFKCKCKADFVDSELYDVLFDTIHEMARHCKYVLDESEWPFSSCSDYKKGRGYDLSNFELANTILTLKRTCVEFVNSISSKTKKIQVGLIRGKDYHRDHQVLHNVGLGREVQIK